MNRDDSDKHKKELFGFRRNLKKLFKKTGDGEEEVGKRTGSVTDNNMNGK